MKTYQLKFMKSKFKKINFKKETVFYQNYFYRSCCVRVFKTSLCSLPRCQNPCGKGWFGYRCQSKCTCENNATCDPASGDCNCTSGWRVNDIF